MFAPHCPHCRSRVVLGTRRIVRTDRSAEGRRLLLLRCHCGHLVVDDLGATDQGGADPAVPTVPDRRAEPSTEPDTPSAPLAVAPAVASA